MKSKYHRYENLKQLSWLIMSRNILWLASWYPNILSPYDGDFIQRHAQAVARFQKVSVIYIKKDEDSVVTKSVKTFSSVNKQVNEIIVYYHSLKTGIRFLDRLLSALKYKKTYRKVIRQYMTEKGRPDLVHVHVAWKAGVQAMWVKRKFHIPFIVSEHWSGYFPEAQYGVKDLNAYQREMLQRIFTEAQKVTAVSNELGKAISKNFPIGNYAVVPNVVDTAIFFVKEKVKTGPVQFIHISSLRYEKNIDAILDAFVKLRKRNENFRVVAYGPLIDKYQNYLDKNKLHDMIHFKGEVTQNELAVDLQQSDALILYSRYETFGCVVIEANACGVPVILSDLPVFREYITEEENGLFVIPNNSKALADKLEDFIKGKYVFSPKLIAENAFNKFNYEAVGKQFSAIYENLLTS